MEIAGKTPYTDLSSNTNFWCNACNIQLATSDYPINVKLRQLTLHLCAHLCDNCASKITKLGVAIIQQFLEDGAE